MPTNPNPAPNLQKLEMQFNHGRVSQGGPCSGWQLGALEHIEPSERERWLWLGDKAKKKVCSRPDSFSS